jgi:DNA-binding LacI/PurR family transcriptional regulator
MGLRRPTLREVSAAARVSIFTASRALGGQSGVAEETRKLVLATAQRLGYVPNRIARSLKGDHSATLGVLTANNANLFYATLVRAIEKAVQPAGYHCAVVDAVEDGVYDTARETMAVSALLEQRVAGIVVTYTPTTENMRLLADWRVPLVFVDCAPPRGFDHYPSVMTDSRHGSLKLGRHFAAHGYRAWAFVGHAPGWTTRRTREAGFREASEECGATLDVIEGGNDSRTAAEAVAAYLGARPRARWPRALYASNEPLLNGALRALREHELRIPDEIAVAGFDDFAWADLLDPPMTVVDQHIGAIGQIAGEKMLAALDGEPAGAAHVVTEPILRVRASCGGRARGEGKTPNSATV